MKEEETDYRSSIPINKKGSDDNALAGAEFSLEIKELDTGEWEYLESKTTDENGQLVFDNLIFNTYRIIKTKAPEENTLMADPVIATAPYSSTDGYTSDDWTFNGMDYYCNVAFTVTNTATFDTLMSSGTSSMLPTPMGFSFVLVVGELLMTIKHKRKVRR